MNTETIGGVFMLGEQIIIRKTNEVYYKPVIDKDKCLRCGLCVKQCTRDVLALKDDGPEIVPAQAQFCIGCMSCYFICPVQAVTVADKKYKIAKSGTMPFYELAENRQSIRHFSDQTVDHDDLVKCVEAMRLAPTGRNCEQWKMIIVEDVLVRRQIAEAICYEGSRVNMFAKEDLPVFAVLLQESPVQSLNSMPLGAPGLYFDSGTLTSYFCLQATEIGLSTCIMGNYDRDSVRKILNIPETSESVMIIAVGYAVQDYTRYKLRKSLNEVLSFNQY